MKMWEIKERENRSSRSNERYDNSSDYSEDYECGYEDGYIAAMKEYRGMSRRSR